MSLSIKASSAAPPAIESDSFELGPENREISIKHDRMLSFGRAKAVEIFVAESRSMVCDQFMRYNREDVILR